VIDRIGLDRLKLPLITLVKLWAVLPPGLPKADARYENVLATAELAARLRAQFPEEAPLYLAELVVRRRAGDPRDTLALAGAAAARFPTEWSVLVSAATAERDAHRPDESLAYARRALEQVPSMGSPLHDAALAFAEAGRVAEAVDLLRELSEDFPDYPLSDEAERLLQDAEESR
jgi:tetratricopeptide (TPR) repeat protein